MLAVEFDMSFWEKVVHWEWHVICFPGRILIRLLKGDESDEVAVTALGVLTWGTFWIVASSTLR